MTVKEKAVPAGTDAAAETEKCVAGPADAMEAGSAAAHSIISVAIAARATLRRNAMINNDVGTESSPQHELAKRREFAGRN